MATWKVRAEFRGHRDRVTALAFGPDGRLFTGGLDTVVLGWDVRPPRGPARGTLAEAWEALADSRREGGVPGTRAIPRGARQGGRMVRGPAHARRSPDPARVKALIADLDSDNFATRERATADLKEHWPVSGGRAPRGRGEIHLARGPSSGRGHNPGHGERGHSPRQLRALRAVEVLEWIATKEARALLLELAKGAPDARLTREAAAACKRLEGRK